MWKTCEMKSGNVAAARPNGVNTNYNYDSVSHPLSVLLQRTGTPGAPLLTLFEKWLSLATYDRCLSVD